MNIVFTDANYPGKILVEFDGPHKNAGLFSQNHDNPTEIVVEVYSVDNSEKDESFGEEWHVPFPGNLLKTKIKWNATTI